MNREFFYDVIVIGGGPAGLTAAIYLARACYRVLVIEKDIFGGQITITDEVVNYPGVERVSGKKLSQTMQKQAENFGAEFLSGEVQKIEAQEGTGSEKIWKVFTEKDHFGCFGVILATGAHPRKIGFPGEAEFRGHGIAYCATCDGEFFRGKEIFVIGGGYAAAQESVFLTKYASHVTILIRGEDFSCAKAVAEAARSHPKITVLTNTEVLYVQGDDILRKICYRNKITGKESVYESGNDTFGVFVFAGYEPNTGLLKDFVDLDDKGYVQTDRTQKTSCQGLYAAGDVCQKSLRQVVTAVHDGAVAGTELEKYVTKLQEKTGIHPSRLKKNGNPSMENPASAYFSDDVIDQLKDIFSKMKGKLLLELFLDTRPVSNDLKRFLEELAKYTDKLVLHVNLGSKGYEGELPYVKILTENKKETGLGFHGVPGGHEFTSFILGLYNVAGPGQSISETQREEILKIHHPLHMQVLVTLSCSMCPELVVAAQQIAALNPFVRAEVYDIQWFPKLRETYKVMSVPCLLINGETVSFGKKNLEQLLELIKAYLLRENE